MAGRRDGAKWKRDETLVAFRLYCQTPFGRLHSHNPDIIALAHLLGRTPSAVAMKACNFASLDPLHQSRGVVGLAHRAAIENQIWAEFQSNSSIVADEAELAYEALCTLGGAVESAVPSPPNGPTETTRVVQARRVQQFFRQTVLAGYGYSCAITGASIPALLNASHIIPWAVAAERRADPHNGICLNALHDRAFDRGLITVDEQRRVVLSPRLLGGESLGALAAVFQASAGRMLRMPERFAPASDAFQYHRENIFQAN